MVKNRAAKAAARNLKAKSGITYPRALDMVQSKARLPFPALPLGQGIIGSPVTWQPRQGSILELGGPTGAGKTHLMNIMASASADVVETYVIDLDQRGPDYRTTGAVVIRTMQEAVELFGRLDSEVRPAVIFYEGFPRTAESTMEEAQEFFSGALLRLSTMGYPLIGSFGVWPGGWLAGTDRLFVAGTQRGGLDTRGSNFLGAPMPDLAAAGAGHAAVYRAAGSDPVLLTLDQPVSVPIAGSAWNPFRHRNLWLQAGPVGRGIFDKVAELLQGTAGLSVDVHDFEARHSAGSPDGRAERDLEDLLDTIRKESPGRNRIVMIAGVPQLRTSAEGDQVLSSVAEMAAGDECTFILLGGRQPAHGYWSRHLVTGKNGNPEEHFIPAGQMRGSSEAHHRPLEHPGLMLGIGSYSDEDRLMEVTFGAGQTITVAGAYLKRTAAAQAIAEATGLTSYTGSMSELSAEATDRAEHAGAGRPREDADSLVAVIDLDSLSNFEKSALFRLQLDAEKADLRLILTAGDMQRHRFVMNAPDATALSVDGDETVLVDAQGRNVRLREFWHSRPRSLTPESMAQNSADTKTLETGYGRTRPRTRPVEKLDLEIGDTLRFHSGRTVFTARAVSENFVVATGKGRGQTVYTIIDWDKGQRGPHNSWGFPVTNDEECAALAGALEKAKSLQDAAEANPLSGTAEFPWPYPEVELSVRRAVYLDIRSVHRGRQQVWPAPVS